MDIFFFLAGIKNYKYLNNKYDIFLLNVMEGFIYEEQENKKNAVNKDVKKDVKVAVVKKEDMF